MWHVLGITINDESIIASSLLICIINIPLKQLPSHQIVKLIYINIFVWPERGRENVNHFQVNVGRNP